MRFQILYESGKCTVNAWNNETTCIINFVLKYKLSQLETFASQPVIATLTFAQPTQKSSNRKDQRVNQVLRLILQLLIRNKFTKLGSSYLICSPFCLKITFNIIWDHLLGSINQCLPRSTNLSSSEFLSHLSICNNLF